MKSDVFKLSCLVKLWLLAVFKNHKINFAYSKSNNVKKATYLGPTVQNVCEDDSDSEAICLARLAKMCGETFMIYKWS